LATACVHAFSGGEDVYSDHSRLAPYSDSALANCFVRANFWLTNNGIPPSKILATHNSEIGLNAFAELVNWGVEYFPIEVQPGQNEYYATPPVPWLMAGPYRLYDPPGLGESWDPLYYADWLTVPGHSEFNGRFFNVYTEIRNVNPATAGWFEGGDWGPTSDVVSSILHGTAQLKRALDSQVLATVFTHENYTVVLSDANWRAILQGITNNLASYSPIYVTLDYADQYVRATHTSRLLSTAFDLNSGLLTATFSGWTDLPTGVFVFSGEDNSISNVFSTISVFSNGLTATVGSLPAIPSLLETASLPAAPSILSIQCSNRAVVFTWSSTPGLAYTLQATTSLTDATWTNLTLGQVATGATLTVTNLVEAIAQRYYRVLMSTPR